MNQVSAVAPRVAMRQLHDRMGEIHLVLGCNGIGAFVKLGDDRQRDKQAEAEGDQWIEVANAGCQQNDHERTGSQARP